jgi:hypothetical protein
VLSKEMERRIEGKGVNEKCMNNGMIDYGIWRNVKFKIKINLKIIIKGLFK